MPIPDGHHTADRRSLAMHQLVAEKFDQEVLLHAQQRVSHWKQHGVSLHERYVHAWDKILQLPCEQMLSILVEDSERGRDLRQTSPFAGVLTNQERWRIIKEVW